MRSFGSCIYASYLYLIRYFSFARGRCPFIDGEEMRPHEEYPGKGVCRSLFVSGHGMAINATYNIMEKIFPDAFTKGIRDISVHPVCRNVFSVCECT